MLLYVLFVSLFLNIMMYFSFNTYPNYYVLDSITIEHGMYYGVMKSKSETCKYLLEDLNNFNAKLIIQQITLDVYILSYKQHNSHIAYNLFKSDDYCYPSK